MAISTLGPNPKVPGTNPSELYALANLAQVMY